MKVFNRSDLIKWIVNGITEQNYIEKFEELKTLGFLKKEANIMLDDKGIYHINTYSFETVEKLKEALNNIIDSKFNGRQDAEIQKLKENMLIGTEFTFRRKTYGFSINDLEMEEETENVRNAIDDIDRWMNLICETGKNGKRHPLWDEQMLGPGKEIYPSRNKNDINKLRTEGNKNKCENKILYSNDEGEKFWVNFSLDSNCIELQTKPVPTEFYENNIIWLQEDLFGNALAISNRELYPDQKPDTGGGGHITIDLAASFGDNAIGLRNFIILYHMFSKFNDSVLGECQDSDNAPFMYEIDEIEDFRRVIEEFDAGDNNMSRLLNIMNYNVYTKSTPKLRETLERTILKPSSVRDREIAGVLPHYQAINLENMECGSLSRFELRRFNAQMSIQELINELEVIIGLIYAANHEWRRPVDFFDYGEDKF